MMTHRERVYATINHKEPDRVPISFDGIHATSMTECPPDGRACSALYEYLGIENADPPVISPCWNVVTNVDKRVVDRLHSDMRRVAPNPPGAITDDDGTKTWPWLFGMRIKKVGLFDEPFEWPMRYMTTKKDIDEYPWPDPDVNITDGAVEKARYLHEETDYFVVGESVFECFPFNGYAYLSGMDKWLSDMKVRPKFYHQLSERFLEMSLIVSDQFYGGIGKYIDAALIQDDIGTQTGPIFSLADFRAFYKPYTAQIIKNIRRHLRPEAKIIMHTCGSIYYAIPDLIEIGVDVINPVQPLAHNMEPSRLKKEFGNKITFFGGFDEQQLLPLGTEEQITEGVKKLLAEYAPGGGFIFGPAHIIPPDVPPKNIVAMYDAAYEYGSYPVTKEDGISYIDYIRSLNLH